MTKSRQIITTAITMEFESIKGCTNYTRIFLHYYDSITCTTPSKITDFILSFKYFVMCT